MIKIITCNTPILKPVDTQKLDPIWVVCDASARGIGAFYGQGPEWRKARPAGFLSKKFTPAQCNYHTWEHELIAILEALIRWEDKLIGRRFIIVTDHKALTFFKSKIHMSDRQTRWWEFLSRFEYDLVYTKGTLNKVADSLSRYYITDEISEIHPRGEYVNVDARIDPSGDFMTENRKKELALDFPKPIITAARGKMVVNPYSSKAIASLNGFKSIDSSITNFPNNTDTPCSESSSELMAQLGQYYKEDNTFNKIALAPVQYADFWFDDQKLYTTSRDHKTVLCIPDALWKGRRIPEIIIDNAHSVLGHIGPDKTLKYLRIWFWWPKMTRDTFAFCESCGKCQMIKTSNQRPAGLLHNLPIPNRPWASIGIDFMGPLPESNGYDYIMVVICRLTSMIHLIATVITVKATEVAELYYREIVRLHGLPESIVSDRDSKFTSKFWKELHRITGGKLLMSTAFHPQTDGTTERSIRSVNQALRAFVNDNQTDWHDKLPSIEFAFNSTTNSSSSFAPFELNCGWMPTMINNPILDTPYKGVRQFAEQAVQNLESAHDAIIASRVHQTHHANAHRRDDDIIPVGGKVYLSTKNLNLPKGRVRKLLPKFIGPYTVLNSNPSKSTYTVDLPENLRIRHIHPTFHVSLLKPHKPNHDDLFPKREAEAFYDFGADPDHEWVVDELIDHKWSPNLLFKIKWVYGDYTWQPLAAVSKLAALDRYLELHGVSLPRELPRVRPPKGVDN
jgi:hypothetical protein